jgi:tRNA pseudouridine55 synthase
VSSSPFEGLIVPIDKPAGLTSFDVVARIRRASGVKRVGHGGTLDPFATGVLVIGIGRSATRQLGELLKGDKEYLAQVVLGIETDTYDFTGRVVAQHKVEMPDAGSLDKVLVKFTGTIKQTPPHYSAVKVGGMRAYRSARRGEKPDIQPRAVTIHQLNLIELNETGFTIDIICSHGTYIRSLAHDIGQALGCGAHLAALRRLRVGPYILEQSETLENFISRLRGVR